MTELSLEKKLRKENEALKQKLKKVIEENTTAANAIFLVTEENDGLKPYKLFYDHILAHLPEGHEVQCKICQQTFAQIIEIESKEDV